MVGVADEEEASTQSLASSKEQILLEIATELQVEAGESSVHPERMLRLDRFVSSLSMARATRLNISIRLPFMFKIG
jgi:hypothetical protein